MFRALVTNMPVLQAPSFSSQQMRTIGRYAIALEASRIRRGINVNDQPAKPLSAAYIKQKLRAGDAPIRNLMLTGAMLNARTIIDIGTNTVQLGFTDSTYYLRATVNERIEPMLGLSPTDVRKLDSFIARFLAPAQLALAA